MTQFVGYDNNGDKVSVGSVVNHTEKMFREGVVVEGGASYKGEPAVYVDYSKTGGPNYWLNRLSKLRVVAEAATATTAPAGLPSVAAEPAYAAAESLPRYNSGAINLFIAPGALKGIEFSIQSNDDGITIEIN